MSSPRRVERASRQVATAAALFLLSACGSDDRSVSDVAGQASTTATAPTSSPSETAPASSSQAAEGDDGGESDAGDQTDENSSGDSNENDSGRHPLPDVNVFDVGAGSEINLTSIEAETPILLWFYAPH